MSKLSRILSVIFCYLFYSRRFSHYGKRVIIKRPDLLFNTKRIWIDDNVFIWKGARIETFGENKDNKPKLFIGKGTSIHMYFHCGAAELVRIGKDVLIAGRVFISDHDHNFQDREKSPAKSGITSAPVVIEDEVWIGEGAAILKGVTIGKHSVIGANSVVTKDVPPYSVAAGVPAKVIQRIE